jgi:PAS domain S-box-containing protein
MHSDDSEMSTSGSLFSQLQGAQRLSREYNELLDVLPDIIYKIDPEGHFVYLSKSIELLGYTKEELIGRHFSIIVHPDDLPSVSREAVLPHYRGKITGNAHMPKLFDERRSGQRVTKNLVVRLIPKGVVAGGEDDDQQAMQSEITASGQYRVPDSSTDLEFEGSLGTIRQMNLPLEKKRAKFYGEIATFGKYNGDITNSERKFDGTVGVIRDITDRTQLEQENVELEAQLLRSQKMEALGTLAGGVAHDLNNILGVLVGFSELMLEMIPEENPARSYAADILKASEKGAVIVQDLLTLARRGAAGSKVINLNRSILDYFKSPEFDKLKAYHQNVTFRMELEGDLLNIKGSAVHVGKTVMNLVSNAAEAISGRGEVVIRTENRHLELPLRNHPESPAGDYVVMTVSDNGEGIAPAELGKIFEPFYTKKVMGKSGTGLGLAVVWGTVQDHDGYIDVASEKGKGSAFTIYLPVTREELTADKQKLSPDQYLGRGESILVVDDVEAQRKLAASMLTRLNYNVSVVSSGEEAVEYIKTCNVDLVVLDMIMGPGIDGLETFRQIVEINPDQKAVIVSGFSETDRVKKVHELGAGAYIQKPYILERIGTAVKNELAGGQSRSRVPREHKP